MNSKIDAAIARITEEAGENRTLIKLEEHLTQLCTTEEVAEKILEEKKTLKGFYQELKKYASGLPRYENTVAIDDEEVYERLEEYYEIGTVKAKADEVIDVFDFL